MTASQQLVFHEATSLNTRPATGFMPSSSASACPHGYRRSSQPFLWLLLLILVALAGPRSWAASPEFATIPQLYFTTTFGLDNPMSQVITVASTGTSFAFAATASTNGGGNWLSINPSNFGCCGEPTPYGVTVTVAPAVTLTAGTYTGQIEFTATGVTPMTVDVSLTIHATTDTYFDQIAGGLTFNMATEGLAPPGQLIQVRNAGAGTLSWTASTSTADGGSWLSLSSSSGSAPSHVTVSVNPANLPGGGLTAGTFVGQVLLSSSNDTETVPISIYVGSNVFAQVNPLSFVKAFGGANPLAQEITLASTGTAFNFSAVVSNSTGGSWLSINPSNYGCCGESTPYNVEVSVNPAITLAAGTYMAEVIVNASGQVLSIPVTLTINPPTNAYLDNVAGALNFSMATGGEAPPAQNIQMRNAGAGSLDWTAVAETADGDDWLSVSQASGTAPNDITVAVNPAKLPGAGLVAGTFIGQVALLSPTGNITIPVSLPVSAATFRQVNPLSFTKVFGGANPLSQVITIASTGTNFNYSAVAVSATGGSWLSINPSNYGCCGDSTPNGITVSVNPAITLAVGTYSAEVLVSSGSQAMMIPVTLTVESATSTFFDETPGQMAFYMATGGFAPPAQVLPIRNAGQGSLDWTAEVSTSDGGNWLSISSDNGTAPSEPTVSVNPANVPGGGLVAGTFTGEVLLQQNGQQISVPVSFIIGANVFYQSNPLSFTMTQGGANPLPQVFTLASTGTTFPYAATVANSTGGSWLTINPSNYGCCGINTPNNIIANVSVPPTLAAGTYSAEIIVNASGGLMNLTVPVTLYVEPNTAAYFDSLPGALSYSMATGGFAPPSQPLQIRNAGAGELAWTAIVTTSDGGNWLTISSASGTAPAAPQVSVSPAKLPGLGLVAGTFIGQVILSTDGNSVTVPVVVTVGANVFRQENGLNFNKTFGGPSPLPQLINFASTGTSFAYSATAVSNSGGGNWLSISPSNYGCCGVNTPDQLVVTLNPAVTLAVGTYSGEIILEASGGAMSMVVPVTLTINAPNTTYFDDVPGAISFFQATGGANPAGQTFAIRNGGTGPGTLSWKATASTSDGGNWLQISSLSGTAPDSLTVSVTSSNLPGEGLTAGQFNGQIVLTADNDIETIPVGYVVGANVFEPVKPLVFNKPYGGFNPGEQPINLVSTGNNFSYFGLGASATGGSWLSINPSSFGCCGAETPNAIEVLAAPGANLAPGAYLGEVIVTSAAGDQGMVVPVTLNVESVPANAPVISRASGFYVGVQTLTISDSTPGATIYYSLDGKTPTNASTPYKAGSTIVIPVSEKIEAIAYATGFLPSAVSSASYTIVANTPKITPAGGAFVSDTTVTITDAFRGSEIFYTINGTTKPKKSSTRYSKPFTVSKNETVMAVAFAPGVNESTTVAAKFVIKAATPKFSVKPGKYTKAISVAITDATKGAGIFYNTNEKAPTEWTRYTKAIAVSKTETIKAMAVAPGGDSGAVATATYTIDLNKPSDVVRAEATAAAQQKP
jgi:hypothetical protein